jgi:hypothetical protein
MKQLNHKTREIKWLIGNNSPLSLENKLIIYKMILKPKWIYGIVLWGCASKSNRAIKQIHQSKILRTINNASWYVANQAFHTDLQILVVRTVIKDRIHKNRTTLVSHPNPLLELMLDPEHKMGLKRRWTFHNTN